MRKTENINGIDYTFHISCEFNQQYITGNIQLLNNNESFRQLENPSLILKRILYYHIYSDLDKYLIVKTANIETSEEYQALFEVMDLDFKNTKFKETVPVENSQEIVLSIGISDSFVFCDEIIESPFGGNSITAFDTNSRNIMNLFRNIVFHLKIEDINFISNSYTAIFEDAVQRFNDKKFGNAFALMETERINCNPKEIQIKYTIMPNGF